MLLKCFGYEFLIMFLNGSGFILFNMIHYSSLKKEVIKNVLLKGFRVSYTLFFVSCMIVQFSV